MEYRARGAILVAAGHIEADHDGPEPVIAAFGFEPDATTALSTRGDQLR